MANHSQPVDPIKIRLIAPAAAAAAGGLLSPVAWTAPGDLDPGFGDVGRALYGAYGEVWAIAMDGEDVLFDGSGSDVAYYSGYNFEGFLDRFTAEGVPDDAFQAWRLPAADFRDIVRQPDGKVVAAGRTRNSSGRSGIAVMRLERDGSLDADFGTAGTVVVEAPGFFGQLGTSMVLEPDGRITVAGVRDDGRFLVLRLSADGSLDPTFGDGGVYVATERDTRPQEPVRIVRTATGAYRIATSSTGDGCRLVGLTSTGVLDTSFGTLGLVSTVSETVLRPTCPALVADGSDGLYVAGGTEGPNARGYATRLDAHGSIDAAFDADATTAGMRSVTALAVGGGSVFLAGDDASGLSGALIARLTQSGLLDTVFGDQGRTWFDAPTRTDQVGAVPAVVRELEVLDGRRLVASGSVYNRPVVARYRGDAAGGSPGILAFESESGLEVAEADGRAVARVRRVGGRDGAVSVAYETVAVPGDVWIPTYAATPGQDYTPVAGRLEWAHGDTSVREISVPLIAGRGETTEVFALELSDPQGGAGLGTDLKSVSIQADGDPSGFAGITGLGSVTEGDSYRISVIRYEFGSGAVSVTVSVAAGSATAGTDYEAFEPVTLNWADGELGVKDVYLRTVEDSAVEGPEQFTVVLGNPTGGIVFGVDSAVVAIQDDDASSGGGGSAGGGGGSGRGGGGSAGGLLAGLFALLGLMRRPGTRRREIGMAGHVAPRPEFRRIQNRSRFDKDARAALRHRASRTVGGFPSR